MRKLKTIAVAFLFLFSLFFVVFNVSQVHAVGTSYYVSTTGDDGDDGSLATPFKTIQKACNVSTNGDTIFVMAGTYNASKQIIIQGKTASNDWLTLRNYNTDLVIIDGFNCPVVEYQNASLEIKSSKYIRITGLTFNHSRYGGMTLRTGTSFVRVDNCSFTNATSFAFKSSNGLNNVTFEYNYLYNNFCNWSGGLPGAGLGQETVSLENLKDFSVNNNTFMNNRAENIDMKGGCKNGIVCYNTINTTGGYVFKVYATWGGLGIYLDSRGVSSNISIYNNNIYGNVSGISIGNEVASGHYENISIYNNVVNITATGGTITAAGRCPLNLERDSGTAVYKDIYIYSNTLCTGANIGTVTGNLFVAGFTPSYLKRVYIVNNIFYTKTTTTNLGFLVVYGITFEDGVFIINNNSYYRPTGALKNYWKDTYYTSTSNPEKFGGEPVFTDQQFVDNSEQGGDYHLQVASPCIDVGSNVLAPNVDFDDLQRPQGVSYDIGAYEYPAPITILIASDSDFNVINGVRYGSGTVANPYVICNYNIYNISVSGTTKNLTIYNCTILHHALISGLSASSNLLFDTVTMDGAGHIPLSYIYLTHTLTTFTNSKFYTLSYSYMKNG